jgi:lipoprotein-anchoring transpeptidase ErfK/SrfK
MHLAAICLAIVAAGLTAPAPGHALTIAEINEADPSGAETTSRAVVIKAAVLLDRAGFSPGAIDGRTSPNFVNALRAFQQHNGLAESGQLDGTTWSRLVESSGEPAMTQYMVTAEDVRGPFTDIPDTYERQAALKQLAFTGPAELLAERFHMDEDLLGDLNDGKPIDRAGVSIVVANVRRAPLKVEVERLVVDKLERSVRAFDRDGKLVGFFPASLGSDDRPAPSGTLKITRVVRDPVYYYDPKFQFPGVNARQKLKIAPGPNNPVGTVWMNLNERTYGIHGTAEPVKIGRTYSHGCVRLTNWDARALAAMVRKGTVVAFVDGRRL